MSEMTETYLSLMLAYFSSSNSLDRSCQKAQASRKNALGGTAPFTLHQIATSQKEKMCAQLSGDPPHEQQPQLRALLVVFLAVETSSS